MDQLDGLKKVLPHAAELHLALADGLSKGSVPTKVSQELEELWACRGLYFYFTSLSLIVQVDPYDWGAQDSKCPDFWFDVEGRRRAVEVTTIEPEHVQRKDSVLQRLGEEITRKVKEETGLQLVAGFTSDYDVSWLPPRQMHLKEMARQIASDVSNWLQTPEDRSKGSTFEQIYPKARVHIALGPMILNGINVIDITPDQVRISMYPLQPQIERILERKGKSLLVIPSAIVLISSRTPYPPEMISEALGAAVNPIPNNWDDIYYVLPGSFATPVWTRK